MSIPAALSRNGPLRSDQFQQPFVADLTLGLGRVHEFCGDARRRLALMLAARMTGDVFWIAPAWEPARLNPQGFHDLVEPARITFVTVKRAEDLLWCMEEVLRSGAVPLAVVDVPGLPHLTPVRRMHLAAEAGADRGAVPLGILLTPGDGGAQGVETRWRLRAAHAPGHEAWHLTRLRARMAAPRDWRMQPGAHGMTLTPWQGDTGGRGAAPAPGTAGDI